VVISSEWTTEEGDRDFQQSYTVTLDGDSYLPLATDYSWGSDAIPSTRWETHWQGEFVEADTLPGGFFDPESIGYVEEIPTP
jgi:hypothetical protein